MVIIYVVGYVCIEYRVNIYKTFNILFSHNNMIFEEGLKRSD